MMNESSAREEEDVPQQQDRWQQYGDLVNGQWVPMDVEEQRRANVFFRPDCCPVRELRWWAGLFGDLKEGMRRLLSSLFAAASLELERMQSALGEFDADKAKEFLDLLCSWLEHVICVRHLLGGGGDGSTIQSNGDVHVSSTSTITDETSWTDSALACKLHIKSTTDSEPQRVCSRSFRAGDIVWNCKQCQMDTTCVLCQQCFRDSDHEGHDVYFYHVMTDAGGCCDCGDPGAWDPRGFCVRHGGNTKGHNDLTQLLAPGVGWAAEMVVGATVAWLTNAAQRDRPQLEVVARGTVMSDDASFSIFKEEATELYERVNFAAHRELRPKEQCDEMALPILLKNWLVTLERAAQQQVAGQQQQSQDGQTIADTAGPFVLCALSLDNVEACQRLAGVRRRRDGNPFRHFEIRCENADALISAFFAEHLATWLLRALCVDSDAFTRIACHALTEASPNTHQQQKDTSEDDVECSLMPLKEMVVRDLRLPASCCKALRNLYIRLLVDRLFKQRFAVGFAKVYRRCARARIKGVPVLESSDLDTVFGLSVQFLNRANHVVLMVHEHGFLSSILESLLATIKVCEQPSQLPGQTELDLLNTVLTHRKTKCLVIDFQYVLNTQGISHYVLDEDRKYLAAWFDILASVYGMHEQTRIVEPYALNKDERWVPAFNLSLSLLSLFADLTRYLMFGELMDLDANDPEFVAMPPKQHARVAELAVKVHRLMAQAASPGGGQRPHGEWCSNLVAFCAERTAAVLDARAPASVCIMQVDSLLGQHPYSPYNVTSLPVTFHCLLQRFFGMIYSQCVASTLDETLSARIIEAGKEVPSFWLTLMRQPLNALILFATCAAGMWNRNEDMGSQAMNYQSLPFVSGMFMDIRVLQTAALNLPGDTVISYIVHAFDLTEWLGLGKSGSNGPNMLHARSSNSSINSPSGTIGAAAPGQVSVGCDVDSDSEDSHPGVGCRMALSEEDEVPRFGQTARQSEALAASMLELLCVAATELPPPTPFAFKQHYDTTELNDPRIVAESDKILRREVVHSMAIKRSTFSIINDNCAHLKQMGVTVSAGSIRQVLSEVTDEISRSDGMGPIQYELKPAMWAEFDPLFHRLARNEKDDARERWLALRTSETVDKPCFPGDTKPKAASHRSKPLPAAPFYANVHPAFSVVRDKLLLGDAAFILVRQALAKICKDDPELVRRQQCAAVRAAQFEQQRRVMRADSNCVPLDKSASIGGAVRNRSMSESSVFNSSATVSLAVSSNYSVIFIANVLHLLTLQLHQIRAIAAAADVSTDGEGEKLHSLKWYMSKVLIKDPVYKESILDYLLLFWYNDPKIDETNRESVRWLLAQFCELDPRALRKIKKTYKAKKPALQAEKEKLSRKRKAQRQAMNSMRQSQELAARAFAMDMDASGDGDVDDGNDAETTLNSFPEDGPEPGSCGSNGSALGMKFGSAFAVPPPPNPSSDVVLTPALQAINNVCSGEDESDVSIGANPLRLRVVSAAGAPSSARKSGASFSDHSLLPSRITSTFEVTPFSLDDGGKKQRTGIITEHMMLAANEEEEDGGLEGDEGIINQAELNVMEIVFGGNDNALPPWVKQVLAERQLWSGPECVSCHERHRLDEGATCYIGYRQSNDMLVRAKAETTDKYGWCVYWAEHPGRNYTIQLCGHAIHAKCLERYRSSIQVHAANALDMTKNEFLCPLCKKLSNFEMPCIPPSFVYGPAAAETSPPQQHQQLDGACAPSSSPSTVLDRCAAWFSSFQTLPAQEASMCASPLTLARPASMADNRFGGLHGLGSGGRSGGSVRSSYDTCGDTASAGMSGDAATNAFLRGAAAAAATIGDSFLVSDEDRTTGEAAANVGALGIGIDKPSSLDPPMTTVTHPTAEEGSTTQLESTAFFSRQLEPLSEALRNMSGMDDARLSIPFTPSFSSHSEAGRLREIQMMVLLDRSQTPRSSSRRADPIAVVFSVALTFVAEREAAYFAAAAIKPSGAKAELAVVSALRPKSSQVQSEVQGAHAGLLSTTTVKKMKRMLEACRGLLLADSASGTNVVISEMYEFFSNKRGSGFHSVLHQSPEMLLFLAALRDLSLDSVKQAVRATYVLCLVQTLIDQTPEMVAAANAKVAENGGSIGSQRDLSILEGAAELREALLSKFRAAATSVTMDDEQQPLSTLMLTNAVLDSLASFVHFAQMLVTFVNDGSGSSLGIFSSNGGLVSSQNLELVLVPRNRLLSYMHDILELPSPQEVLRHRELMIFVIDWVDQSLACLPGWVPRALSSRLINPHSRAGSSSTSSHTTQNEEAESASQAHQYLPRARTFSVSSVMSACSHASGERGSSISISNSNVGKVGRLGTLVASPMPSPSFARPLSIRPLVHLRHSYTEQYVEVHQGTGTGDAGSVGGGNNSSNNTESNTGNGRPAQLAVCLICGQVLLAGRKPQSHTSIRGGEKGECTKHMEVYHNGIGMVLLFRSSSNVLLINGACAAYFGSLYADQNGDDQQVIPSLPMFLDEKRYARVQKLWVENNIPHQVASLRNQSNQMLRLSYF